METIASHAQPDRRRETSQLRRLETLTYGVYGISSLRVRPDHLLAAEQHTVQPGRAG
jgi:hypothetical protein